ncbi:MBL fold metallo-hydrolase [Antribacter sp. KLBMP9083]|uniref:MBL fold metallo-hydrolase n=1 Tax=Antribacter soli TaxID=2910976 RepID=A0AA41QDB4_9MICO|nr:MBL fold metallo-hydrolase [Antribacter soli]MCF4120695.1 MBL fold metallo-hydrolase [Antribacter soli]
MPAVPVPITSTAAVLRADNPGPMTLDGTRSYALRAPGARGCVIVDPGPDDVGHLAALADAGPVELILVTHRHADHTAGSPGLRSLTGAPVRAADPAHCHGGEPLRAGEVIDAVGLQIEVVATPGHTADSVCFAVTAPGAAPVVLTGDTVLGRGTTVIAEPDGSLRQYLASLDLLERLPGEMVPGGAPPASGTLALPGHGEPLPDLAAAVRAYRVHRLERLDQVRSALGSLRLSDAGPRVSPDLVEAVARLVYAAVDESVLPAARQTVAAQLAYLAGDG